MAARLDIERGRGVPLTDAERRARHLELYGTEELPPRGTGLAQMPARMGTSRALWMTAGAGIGAGVGAVLGVRVASTIGGVIGSSLGSALGVLLTDRIIHTARRV